MRDRDDRSRQDERYNKYESERDVRRDPAARELDRREPRRMSAPRDSQRNDSQPMAFRNAPGQNDRPVRDRGHGDARGGNDRSYPPPRSADVNDWSAQNTSGPNLGARDNKDGRPYPRGVSSHNAPGPGSAIMGNHHKPIDTAPSSNQGTWSTAPERRPTHPVVQQATDPRGWSAVPSNMAPRTVINTPMLQVQPAPATHPFITSAANIMMGVGLAQRGTETRYDAYKTLQPSIRRY